MMRPERCAGVRSHRVLGHGKELRYYSRVKGRCWITGIMFLKITLTILGERITAQRSGGGEARALARETMEACMRVEAMVMENDEDLRCIPKAEVAGFADE